MTPRSVVALVLLFAAALGGGMWYATRNAGPGTGINSGSALPEDAFRPLAPEPLATACPGLPTGARADREVRLRLFHGAGVREAEVATQMRRLSTFYAAYGLRFVAPDPVVAIDDAALVAGTKDEIMAVLSATERADEDPDRARGTLCDLAMGPLRGFLRAHAQPAEDAVNVVVLRHVAAPGSVVADWLPDLRGLTFSPLRRPDDAEIRDVTTCLGVIDGYTPTILLGLDRIDRRYPGDVDLTLAHEMGHAFGLAHGARKDDLMTPGPTPCVPWLTPDQLAVFATAALR